MKVTQKEKKNILIIFGGTSEEYLISCRSAASILKVVDKEKYNPLTLGITKEGRWYMTKSSPEKIANGTWNKGLENTPAIISPDREIGGVIAENNKKTNIDCVFPITHGKLGEDGAMQGLLDLAGIPYVGSGVSASACAMDKVLTKIIAEREKIRQAKYYATDRYNFASNPTQEIKKIEETFGGAYPLFVKPANSGSSVGISKVASHFELFEGIKAAAIEDHKILIEEAIVGRELEIGILGNRKPLVSKVGEIVSVNDFYDYESKYISKENQTSIVDDLPKHIEEEIQEIALKIYRALGCQGLARVDFFLTEDNRIIFNEINTLPGFTDISMYPKLWEATGVEYGELVSRLIELALDY